MAARLPTRSPDDHRRDVRDQHSDSRSDKDKHHGNYSSDRHSDRSDKNKTFDNSRSEDEPDRREPRDYRTPPSSSHDHRDQRDYRTPTSEKHLRKDSRPRSRPRSPDRRRSRSPRRRSPLTAAVRPSTLVKIPSDFKQDSDYLDSTKRKGFALPRYVVSTTFTEEIGIAGASTIDLPIAALVLGGLDNWGLRFVASGQRGYWCMSRTYRESQLFYGMGQCLKDHDLDNLASAFARARIPPLACGTNEEKKIVMEKFAAHVVEFIAQVNPQKALESRISELEAENARLATQPAALIPAPNPVGFAAAAPAVGFGAAAFPPPPPTINPLDCIRKPSTSPKFLARSAPTAFKARDIGNWIKRSQTHPDQKLILEDLSNEINDIYESCTGEKKIRTSEEIRAIATEWGLPFGIAGTADIKFLIKVLAATATINT